MASTAASTMFATTTNAIVHVLVFPYPAQGHMLPLLDLTHRLALHGLKLTILVTPKNLPALKTLLLTHPDNIQTLVLPFPLHPKLPLGVENLRDIGNSGNAPFIASLSKLEGEVFRWFQSHHCPPQVILSDFFLGWTQHLAEKLKIPRIGFFSSGAFLTCFLTHLLLNMDSLWGLDTVEFPDLPRSPSFVEKHLPSLFRKYKKGDSDWEIVRESMVANTKSWGIIFNSFYALEGEYLDHMKKILGHGRIYSIGPLNLISEADGWRRSNLDFETRREVFSWLDKCPDESVLYVCFGSQKLLTGAQMEALALGLERTKTRFVWVTKCTATNQKVDGDHKWNLDEFKERVRDQGLVVRGWAPQVEILNHKSVGGFLSHCGWNSLLEGLVAGVTILAWPMEADQYVNGRLLVEDLQMAVRVCEGEDTVPDPLELAQTISESIQGNLPQRDRAKVMREKAFEAVKAGGSSSMDLDELTKVLSQIKVPNT